MKKRRLVISLFLIAAVATISFGYAALTRNLIANTDIAAGVDNSNLKVEFVQLPVFQETDDIKVTKVSGQEISIAFNQQKTMTEKGDSQSIELKVQNNSENAVGTELDATLQGLIVVSDSNIQKDEVNSTTNKVIYKGTHFTIVAEWVLGEGEDLNLSAQTHELVTLKITISLNVTTTTPIERHDFAVKFSAVTA